MILSKYIKALSALREKELALTSTPTISNKERKQKNDTANKLVKDLIRENRKPTEEEKATLIEWSGKGGLGNATEYFTPDEVASAVWKFLDVKSGDTVLDPSTGNGVFSRTAQNGVKIKGCDLNPISANIANITNDNSNIIASSFEEYQSTLLDNSLDGVITNVPFGNREKPYNQLSESRIKLHEDYFIIQSLKKLKVGKRGVFLTTSSQSQRKGSSRMQSRKDILRYGALIKGLRLPSETFTHTGTTQVVDVLVFEKHPVSADNITPLSWDEMIEESPINRSFLAGEYFDKHPENILGDFISQEQMREQAAESGETIHHQLQRDTVTLKEGMTLQDAYSQIALHNTGVNELDYSRLEERQGNGKSTSITKGLTVTETQLRKSKLLLDAIDAINRGSLAELPLPDELKNNYQSFGNEIGQILTQKERELIEAHIMLSDKGYSILNGIVFSRPLEDSIDSIIEHENEIKKFMRDIRTFRHSPYILNVIQRLTHFDFKQKEFININEYRPKEINIDESKKVNGFYPKDLFTDKEILEGQMLVFGDKVQRKEDFLLAQNNSLLSQTLIRVSKSDTPDEVKNELYTQLDRDYSSRESVKTFNFPMKSLEEVIGKTLTDMHLSKLIKNNGLKAQALLNATRNIKKLNKFYTEQNVVGSLKRDTMSRIINFFIKAETTTLNPFEKGVINHLKPHIKKGLLDIKPIVQELTNRFINENFEARELVQEWLESQRVIRFEKTFSEENMTELATTIKSQWITGARHYQNSDSRKLAQTLEGGIIWSTGLGKTIGAVMTAMQILHQQTGKRVLYVVLNATIEKMRDEVERTVTSEQWKKTLVISNKNVEDLNNIKDYNFIVIAHSVMTNHLKLKDETIKLLWGAAEDEDTSKFPQNNVRQWVKNAPIYNKKALYNFEDLGVDAMIIDELHTFKNATASLKNVKGLNKKSSNEALQMLFFSEYIKGIVRKDMRGVLGATATPLSNAPSEILTTLLFTTDRKGLKNANIKSLKDFENRYYNIGSDLVLKTDAKEYELKDTLIGIENIDQLHNIGYDKLIFRNAEEEQARAGEKGVSIQVKPPKIVTEVTPILGIKDEMFFNSLSSIQQELSKREREERTVADAITINSMIYREWVTFSYINKAKRLAISKATALGYTQLLISDFSKADKYIEAISKVKVKVKKGNIVTGRYGRELKIKKESVILSEYEKTQYFKLKKDIVPESILPLVEDNGNGTGFLNVPTTDYAELTRIINAIKKAKLFREGDELFNLSSFPKFESMMNNILRKIQENPRAKQLIYSTSIHTHEILNRMIKSEFGKNTKIWIFNDAFTKKEGSKLKIQEEFNNYKDFAIMIFGSSGATGVDFNRYVNAVHLLDIGNTPTEREQAEGRGVRQGNVLEVEVFNYSTKGTFDSFLEALVKGKDNWIKAVNTKNKKALFNDDSISEISDKAELEYGHLNISVEEKIQKYIDKIADENREKQEQIQLALVQNRMEKLKEDGTKYLEISEHGVYYAASENGSYMKDELKTIYDSFFLDSMNTPTGMYSTIMHYLTDILIYSEEHKGEYDWNKAITTLFTRTSNKEEFLSFYGKIETHMNYARMNRDYKRIKEQLELPKDAKPIEVAEEVIRVNQGYANSRLAQVRALEQNKDEVIGSAVAELRKDIIGMDDLSEKEILELVSGYQLNKTIILNGKYYLFDHPKTRNIFLGWWGATTCMLVQGEVNTTKWEQIGYGTKIAHNRHVIANYSDWEVVTLDEVRKRGDTFIQLVDEFQKEKRRIAEAAELQAYQKKLESHRDMEVEKIKEEILSKYKENGESEPTPFKLSVLARREYKKRLDNGDYDVSNDS